jgi:hypothetical protein
VPLLPLKWEPKGENLNYEKIAHANSMPSNAFLIKKKMTPPPYLYVGGYLTR